MKLNNGQSTCDSVCKIFRFDGFKDIMMKTSSSEYQLIATSIQYTGAT